jgi:hypothetical protein
MSDIASCGASILAPLKVLQGNKSDIGLSATQFISEIMARILQVFYAVLYGGPHLVELG